MFYHSGVDMVRTVRSLLALAVIDDNRARAVFNHSHPSQSLQNLLPGPPAAPGRPDISGFLQTDKI